MGLAEDLRGAKELILSKRYFDALAVLLVAWRATMSARVADLIDALDALITPALPVISGPTPEEQHAAWLEVAKRRLEGDVGRLLPLLMAGPHLTRPERVSYMASRPLDPRVSRALAQMVLKPRNTMRRAVPMWRTIFDMLDAHGDTRSAAALRAARQKEVEGSVPFVELYGKRLPKLCALLENAPAEPDTAAKTLATEVEAAITGIQGFDVVAAVAGWLEHSAPVVTKGPVDEAELLAAVYADPQDDGARLVYADWLLEREDPRGKFIQLQFEVERDPTNTKASREATRLQKLHERTWLAPIRPIIGYGGVRFRRGFPAECSLVIADDPASRELASHPALATFEVLRGDVMHVMGPHLRALQRLAVDDAEAVVALAEHLVGLALRSLQVGFAVATTAKLELTPELTHRLAASEGRGLPRLQSLEWRCFSPLTVERIATSWIALRVESLRLFVPGHDIGSLAWETLLARFGESSSLRTLELGAGADRVVLRREGQARVVVMNEVAAASLRDRTWRGFQVRIEK